MSGGDLDGDTYFICWDEHLVKTLSPEDMVDPGNYEKPKIIKEKP